MQVCLIVSSILVGVAVLVGVVTWALTSRCQVFGFSFESGCQEQVFDVNFAKRLELFEQPNVVNSSQGLQCYDSCLGNFTSSINFRTWLYSVITEAPVLYPYTDAELQEILENARRGGCKVRVSGATHSQDGFVVQLSETLNEKVVVINLANYIPPSPWNEKLDETTGKLRISAGRTFLDVMRVARPKGFLMETQTAGLFFTVGGVMGSPSVHGATFNRGKLSYYMTGVRAMLANGSIIETTDEEQVRKWRGSMGYLGIILACEIQLRRDVGLLIDAGNEKFETWNKANVEASLRYTFDNYDASEWFIDLYDDRLISIRAKHNGGVTDFDYKATAAQYADLMKKYPNNKLARSGGEAGCDSLLAQSFLNIAENAVKSLDLPISKVIMSASGEQTIKFLQHNNNTVRDLYYVDSGTTLKFYQLYASIQCVTNCIDDGVIFNMLDAMRNFYHRLEANVNKETWFPTMVMEFRLIDCQPGAQLLENMDPGLWLGFEIITSAIVNQAISHLKYFEEIEQLWYSVAPRKVNIHVGKAYAYAPTKDNYMNGTPFPFQNATILDNVFNQSVKDAFLGEMNSHDPDGLFRAGALLRLLNQSDVMYSPRGGEGATCFTNKNCVSNCCCIKGNDFCDVPLTLQNTCLDVVTPKGQSCGFDCQCASGKCVSSVCE